MYSGTFFTHCVYCVQHKAATNSWWEFHNILTDDLSRVRFHGLPSSFIL